jgi:hypothetical protein
MRSFLRYMTVSLLMLTSQIALTQVVVRVAPPPPVHVGVIGRAPGPGYVWVEGYHRWNGSRYMWVEGHWVRPPRRAAVWVAPAWVRHGNGWVFHEGYWR